MSDQELSDIVTYIRSVPPVDNEVPGVALGPLGKVLVATGQLPLAVERIREHQRPSRDRAAGGRNHGGVWTSPDGNLHGMPPRKPRRWTDRRRRSGVGTRQKSHAAP